MRDKPLDPKKAIKEILEIVERSEREINAHLAAAEQARWTYETAPHKQQDLEITVQLERREALSTARYFLRLIKDYAERVQL